MADIVNLNKFRKNKNRSDDKKLAQENRLKFGRTKAKKNSDTAARNGLDRHLDAHRADDRDET